MIRCICHSKIRGKNPNDKGILELSPQKISIVVIIFWVLGLYLLVTINLESSIYYNEWW